MPDAASASDDLRIQYNDRPPQISVLRVRSPSPECFERLSQAFGLAWPGSPRSGGVQGIYCTGPCEWAIVGRAPAFNEKAVAGALDGYLHHLAHVGVGRRTWRVAGRRAPDLLSRGAAIDFHPKVFTAGASAQTLFAQVFVLIARPQDELAYELIADASYQDHLNRWFECVGKDV
jgi:sarcosine oxidase subunit gamma